MEAGKASSWGLMCWSYAPKGVWRPKHTPLNRSWTVDPNIQMNATRSPEALGRQLAVYLT